MWKRSALVVAILLVGVAAEGKTWKTEQYRFDAGAISVVELEHPVGELEIVAGSGAEIEVHMRVECSSWRDKCGDRTERIELVSRQAGETLELRIEGFPKSADSLSVNLEIRMPARLSLDLERGVGETTVRDIEGDILIDSGVGEVTITAPARTVGEVEVECGVGEADLDAPGGRVEQEGFLFLGNELKWHGEGQSIIEVEVGVGSVRVELE